MPIEVSLYRLHPNQEAIRNEAARFNVVACGRRWGKSILGVDLAVETALSGYPAGWFAPEYSLLREAWREFREILDPVTRSANDAERRIELITGGIVDAWAFDRNSNAGRSRKYKRVVIDEAAHCDHLESAWTRAIRPTLTDYRGDAWFLSSPNGKNYFYALHERGRHSLPGWAAWVQPSAANPHLDPAEIEAARRELPDPVFRQEYLAEFLDEVAQVLIPDAWIDRCFGSPRGPHAGPPVLALDVAKGTGRDRTVAIVGDDSGILDLVVSANVGVAAAARLVRDLARQWAVPQDRITFDAGGWAGSDLARHLEAEGIVEAVPYYGSGPGGTRYANRRTRSAWLLRRRLDPDRPRLLPQPALSPDSFLPTIAHTRRVVPERAALPPAWAIPPAFGRHRDELHRELSALRYRVGLKLELEKKDELVRRLGHSPDLADAAIMLASVLWTDD